MKKKEIFLILILILHVTSVLPQNANDFKTLTIGSQTWMMENYSMPMPKSWYYDTDSIANKKYGRLYFWSNAMAATPKGWHLPSLAEWQQLIDNLGGDTLALLKLLDDGSSGLHLLAGGHKSANITPTDLFDLKDQYGYYWTATEKGEQTAYAIELRKKGGLYIVKNYYRKANGFSVRYIKD